jgi:hypothetical protein
MEYNRYGDDQYPAGAQVIGNFDGNHPFTILICLPRIR